VPEMELGPIATLDLSRRCSMSSVVGEAGLRLLTYLRWPQNETRRNQYMATLGAEALDDFSRKLPADFRGYESVPADEFEALRSRAMRGMSKRWFEPFGGFGAVASAPGSEALEKELSTEWDLLQATGQLLLSTDIRNWTLCDSENWTPC